MPPAGFQNIYKKYAFVEVGECHEAFNPNYRTLTAERLKKIIDSKKYFAIVGCGLPTGANGHSFLLCGYSEDNKLWLSNPWDDHPISVDFDLWDGHEKFVNDGYDWWIWNYRFYRMKDTEPDPAIESYLEHPEKGLD